MAFKKTGISIPNPFEIAIVLTLIVLGAATLSTEHSFIDNVGFWGDGLWSLLSFMTQMCLILLGGYVLAASKPVNKLLLLLVKIPKTNNQIYLMTLFVSTLTCWLNWGLGLVASAFFALEMARANKKTNFPLLVAISYMGFIFWHGGLSGSIPLVVGTPNNFSYQWLGELIGFEQTVFSFFNLSLIGALFVSLSILVLYFAKKTEGVILQGPNNFETSGIEKSAAESEEKTMLSKALHWLLLTMFVTYLGALVVSGRFSVGLNLINFILIGLGLFLHGSLNRYMEAIKSGCGKLGPILVQYPLYAGIMGVIIQSGLVVRISNAFVYMSSETTYPLFMFLSAGLVNFFVPSGGGQWAVQAPVVIEGAKQLGVPMWKVVMAVAWGDAWTNLAQPFWALPLLSIVGLGIKDIMVYCLAALLVSGVVIGGFFLFF